MQSNTFRICKDRDSLYEILKEVEKYASYTGMEKKEYFQLRLLAEELVSMLPELMEYYEGEFWISNRGKRYALNVSVEIPFFSQESREHLMALSKSGKNSLAVGITGKIRCAVEAMIADVLAVDFEMAQYSGYGFYGALPVSSYYTQAWSLNNYTEYLHQNDEKENKDELEKSIIAKLSDDVVVGLKGKHVEIVIKKSFDA